MPRSGDEAEGAKAAEAVAGEIAQDRLAREMEKRARLEGPRFHLPKAKLRELSQQRRYVITSAQNNTPVHEALWRTLHVYARDRDATLLVVPTRYRNPTSPTEWASEVPWWPHELVPHLVDDPVRLHRRLVLRADVNVQATAVHPLTGLEPLTGTDSAIFGHAQIALQTVPTPQSRLPKILQTTGSVSVKNYSRTKAGIKGAFHHSLGCAVVETDGSRFHMRSISANNDGTFHDLDRRYTPDGVEPTGRVPGLVLGDLHQWFLSPKVRRATWDDPDSLVKALRPAQIVYHDPFDAFSISHHHANDPFIGIAKARGKHSSVVAELESLRSFLDEVTPEDTLNVFPFSNHSEHLGKWIRSTDWRTDPGNAVPYLELALEMARAARMTRAGATTLDPFRFWMESHLQTPNLFLGPDDSHVISGIEVAMHGHLGPNGSRGNPRSLSRIWIRSTIGHVHSPCILHGLHAVGLCAGQLSYARGPSSWLNTHDVIYPDGKHSLVHVIDGRYRGPT